MQATLFVESNILTIFNYILNKFTAKKNENHPNSYLMFIKYLIFDLILPSIKYAL